MTSPFDEQAASFELRAGLPKAVSEAVARAVVRIAQLSNHERLVDVGAGTGVIGRELVGLGLDYVALEQSRAMLARFASALGAGASPRLLVHDARESWPVPSTSVRAVFGSRSLHWLAPDHVARETARLAHPKGCSLLIGRVVREPDSVRSMLRQKLHELLNRRGVDPRSSKASATAIVEAAMRLGADPIERQEVASWTVAVTPSQTLQGWRHKPGTLGGVVLPAEVSTAVLDELETWTRRAFRNTDTRRVEVERYVLRGAFFRQPSQ